ncbi:MAG: hypothetical protein IJ083_08750 [Clostridia bacterium]|nr:hypothetical protein [Clostridia bacterium]
MQIHERYLQGTPVLRRIHALEVISPGDPCIARNYIKKEGKSLWKYWSGVLSDPAECHVLPAAESVKRSIAIQPAVVSLHSGDCLVK